MVSKALDEAKHHFIVELNSQSIYGSMRCNHKKDDEEFLRENNGVLHCKALETFNGMSDNLIFYSGGRNELIKVTLREVNGNSPQVVDYAAVGKYVEDESGDVILTVEAGVQEDLALMLNGENILGIDAEVSPRRVAFPVKVLSLDESEVDDWGGCMDMEWVITSDGDEL